VTQGSELVQYLLDQDEADSLKRYFQSLGKKVELVWMSPDEFLAKVPHPITTTIPALVDLREEFFSKTSLNYIRKQIMKGEKLPPLLLDYSRMWFGWPTHEGRHRAFVAKTLGIEKVPVLIVGEEDMSHLPGGPKELFRLKQPVKLACTRCGWEKIVTDPIEAMSITESSYKLARERRELTCPKCEYPLIAEPCILYPGGWKVLRDLIEEAKPKKGGSEYKSLGEVKGMEEGSEGKVIGRWGAARNWEGELTLSQIDATIHDVQRYIEDEKKVERIYYAESQNPVIKAINASDLLLEISKEEKTHAQELEALLPKLKEKWAEAQKKLI
jgi:hypothetical protein